MSNQFNPNAGTTKPSDTIDFQGYVTLPQQTSGVQQNSEWASPVPSTSPGSLPGWGVIQGVPAASRVTISCADPRFTRVGPSQYTLRLKLGETATLVGGLTDAQNNVVSPVSSGLFVYGSRQRTVATIDPVTGIISTVGIGGVELTVRFPKGQVNSNFAGATSVIGAGFIEATVQLQVVSVGI